MTKIIYPISEALPGGNLHEADYRLRIDSSLDVKKSGSNIEVNGDIDLDIDDISLMISNSGEVFNHLMVVKAPLAGLDTNVPAGLPDRTKLTASGPAIRKISEWLRPNNIWTTETNFYFISQNIAGVTLKGSELLLLDALPGVSILKITDPEFTALS